MASITCWNRLEPRPRSTDIGPGLSARIRDPLWMLTRQWQFGEFGGEDAASPAFVEVAATSSRFTAWGPRGSAGEHPLGDQAPLEALCESEPFTPDLSVSVELGQTFETLLLAGAPGTDLSNLIAAFRTAYPIPTGSELNLGELDPQAVRFLAICSGRAIDGLKLFDAARSARPVLPAQQNLTAAEHALVDAALARFIVWVEETFGELNVADPVAWNPERLEYSLDLLATAPDESSLVFSATPAADGTLDWSAFDVRERRTQDNPPDGTLSKKSQSFLPTHVRFRGMPNARWWEFENGITSFGDVDLDRRDIARLIVDDFMLVHGVDWFLTPFEQELGTLCRIDSLLVHDVFGGRTLVERADAGASTPGERWTMFSTSDGTQLADFFALPATASTATQSGPIREDVRFLRDEMANMAWAVEYLTEGKSGQPWPGNERDLASRPPPSAAAAQAGPAQAALRYQLQTTVPDNWLPLLPVLVDPERGQIALQEAAMLDPESTNGLTPIEPIGRILRPTTLAAAAPHVIREEEVPRSGIRVLRAAHRSRWTDGSTRIWTMRRKIAGTGEGRSGLQFDLATPTQTEEQ